MTYEALAQQMLRVNPTLYFAMSDHRTHRGKRLDFVHNPFIVRLYKDQHQDIVVMKSTQCGVSEWLLCLVIPGAMSGRNVFYVLPDYGLVSRFVMERFDKTMRMTPSYWKFRQEAKFNQASSVTMKQLGPGTISFAGSTVVNAFTEFAADWYVIDELDRCDQSNLEMGWERLSNAEQQNIRQVKVSNPTITGFGIDAEYARTNQAEWFIRHDCGHLVHPDFFRHVIRDVGGGQFVYADEEYDPESGQDCRMICDICGRPIDRRGQGEWVAKYPNVDRHGYHISKLFSANVKLIDLVKRYEAGEANPDAMVRFYNGDLGLAYDSPGARISKEMLDECIADYNVGQVPADGACIAGIDVGAVFNVSIGHMAYGVPGVNLVDAREIRSAEELLDLLRQYKVRSFVIDALPETRVSRALIRRHIGGYICYYSRGRKDLVSKEHVVSVDRTVALDNVKAAIALKALRLPRGADKIPNFYDQITASTRVLNPEAAGGEGEYTWVNGSKADHYHHSTGYMMMAARLLMLSTR